MNMALYSTYMYMTLYSTYMNMALYSTYMNMALYSTQMNIDSVTTVTSCKLGYNSKRDIKRVLQQKLWNVCEEESTLSI